MSLILPDSGDPWHWVEWMLENERELYVRIDYYNPTTRGREITLVPMFCLEPRQWVFNTQRLFFDRTFPVMSYADWREREKKLGYEPAANMPGWEEA